MTDTLAQTAVRTRPQLVISDLDGTLTDSADGIVARFRHAVGSVGAAVPDGDLAAMVVGPPMHHLFEGIPALLAALRAADVRLAVATAKADVVADAAAQLDAVPDRVLMVGDRSHDVEGAAAHGIDTVVVGWGYGRGDFAGPDAATPVAHVVSVDDLREVLGV